MTRQEWLVKSLDTSFFRITPFQRGAVAGAGAAASATRGAVAGAGAAASGALDRVRIIDASDVPPARLRAVDALKEVHGTRGVLAPSGHRGLSTLTERAVSRSFETPLPLRCRPRAPSSGHPPAVHVAKPIQDLRPSDRQPRRSRDPHQPRRSRDSHQPRRSRDIPLRYATTNRIAPSRASRDSAPGLAQRASTAAGTQGCRHVGLRCPRNGSGRAEISGMQNSYSTTGKNVATSPRSSAVRERKHFAVRSCSRSKSFSMIAQKSRGSHGIPCALSGSRSHKAAAAL